MANPLGEMGQELFGTIFSSIIWFGIIFIIIAAIGTVMYYFIFYRKKFDIRVLVRSERVDGKFNLVEDWAAILYDKKDKNYFMRLLGNKVDLPPSIYGMALQRTNKGDYAEFWKRGEDDFVPLTSPIINKQWVVKADGTEVPIAQAEQKMVEGDIAYWNVKRKEKNRNTFAAENLFMRLLPYFPQIIGSIMVVFVLYILMTYLPEVLSSLAQVVEELKDYKRAEIITTGMILWMFKTR